MIGGNPALAKGYFQDGQMHVPEAPLSLAGWHCEIPHPPLCHDLLGIAEMSSFFRHPAAAAANILGDNGFVPTRVAGAVIPSAMDSIGQNGVARTAEMARHIGGDAAGCAYVVHGLPPWSCGKETFYLGIVVTNMHKSRWKKAWPSRGRPPGGRPGRPALPGGGPLGRIASIRNESTVDSHAL